jgi:hypothetical protein
VQASRTLLLLGLLELLVLSVATLILMARALASARRSETAPLRARGAAERQLTGLGVADEPTGELDSVTAGQVFDALRTVNAESGVTVLVVTHDEAVSGQVRRTIAIRDGRTSTEVLREAGQAGGGTVAEEYAVLDRSGRLQLPADFTESLGMRERVRLALDTDHIGVWPTAPDQPAPAPPEPAGAPLGPGDGQ